MPRKQPGLFGRIDNLNRLIRSALVFDAVLSDGRRWQDAAREVAEQQYVARGLVPPRADVVKRYFSLDLAPALDAGYRTPLAYPTALAMQFPHVRPMFIAPLMDLLFGLDLSKADQLERSQRFSAAEIKKAREQGNKDLGQFMETMNNAMPTRGRGRPSSEPVRPLWEIYQTLLNCPKELVHVLFVQDEDGVTRAIRPIEQELEELVVQPSLDSLALLYGLVLESLELADSKRFVAARDATLAWLPNLAKLPECRRVGPLIEHAVRSACSQAVPRRFSRASAYNRILPGAWRDPSWSFNAMEKMFAAPSVIDSIEFYKFKGLDIKRMSVLIEEHAARWLEPGQTNERASKDVANQSTKPARFPFRGKSSRPIKALYESTSAAVPSAVGWGDGNFWAMQYGTRCAITSPGSGTFALVMVDFRHLRGDAVTDKPLSAMPWITADWTWINVTDDPLPIHNQVAAFLRDG